MAKLEVHVVTPEREVWVGDADSVSARAVDGELGVLPGHIPMLAALGIGVLTIVNGTERVEAAVDGGFLHVVSLGDDVTRVDVLAEHAELAGEIDVSRAAQLRESAERQLGEESTPEARRDLARAQVRLRITGN